MNTPQMGFTEISHTADWSLHVWAPDLGQLFVQAAKGMMRLMGGSVLPDCIRMYDFEMKAGDQESLLVAFLSELLFLAERDEISFMEFSLQITQIDEYLLTAQVKGAPILEKLKEIKAVTYHNLKITSNAGGLQVDLVFDV